MKRLSTLAAVLMGLAVSGAAQAQTLNPGAEAGALYQSQQSGLAAMSAATPNANLIPGYGGDAAGLQGYADNAAGLASAGQSAVAGSDIFQTMSAASQSAGGIGVTNTDSWLQRSLSVVNDPSAFSGGAQGAAGTNCQPTGGTETVTTETLYTCESGNRVTQDTPTCTRDFQPDVTGGSGQVGWSYYTCEEGYRDNPGSTTCDVPLQVTTSSVWRYECELMTYCNNGLNQEQIRCGPFLAGGCMRNTYYIKYIGRTCRMVFVYDCPRQINGPFNNEVITRLLFTTPGTATASWNQTACQALASDASCSLSSEECIEGAATRVINGVSVYQACWKKRRTYSCASITQGAGCFPPAGSQFLSQTCLWADQYGICRLFQKTYRQVSSVTNADGTWSYNPACPAAGDGSCGETESVCSEGPGTRTVNGVSVTADCWRQTATFACERNEGQGSDCDVRPGCTWKEDRCLDEDAAPGQCQTVEHVYSCRSTETQEASGSLCGAQICLGSQCYTLNDQTSSDLPSVFASLATLQAAGDDHADGITLFKGDGLRCRKAVLGFRNCCKDSGWGLDLGLAQCDAQERDLVQKQQAKACHSIGSWCSKKSLFGCVEKSMRYCCFDGALGRIVQEAGRSQIGKGWGSPKSPDCSGFTVEQFQQLDLSRVDFSDFTREAMKTITAPGAGGTVGAIQQSLERLHQSGTPGTGG